MNVDDENKTSSVLLQLAITLLLQGRWFVQKWLAGTS